MHTQALPFCALPVSFGALTHIPKQLSSSYSVSVTTYLVDAVTQRERERGATSGHQPNGLITRATSKKLLTANFLEKLPVPAGVASCADPQRQHTQTTASQS